MASSFPDAKCDLVDRLYVTSGEIMRATPTHPIGDLLYEAAKEIERLRSIYRVHFHQPRESLDARTADYQSLGD